MSENFKMIAKTFYGFEDILARELLDLGAQKIEKGLRNVSFYGDKGFLYKSNLCLRTALKILKPIFHFKFKDIEDYYKNINNFKWEELIDVDSSFVIYVCYISHICNFFLSVKFDEYSEKKIKHYYCTSVSDMRIVINGWSTCI